MQHRCIQFFRFSLLISFFFCLYPGEKVCACGASFGFVARDVVGWTAEGKCATCGMDAFLGVDAVAFAVAGDGEAEGGAAEVEVAAVEYGGGSF